MAQINGDTTKAALMADTHIDLIQWVKNLNWHAKKAVTTAESYTAATPANYNVAPTAQDGALDEIAGRVKSLEATTTVPSSVQVTLTAAQVNALSVTPIQVLPAAVAGTYNEVTSIEYLYTYGSAAFIGAQNITLQYAGTSSVAISAISSTGLITTTSNVSKFQTANPAYASGIVAPVAASVTVSAAGSFTVGTGSTLKIKVYYRTITAQT